MVCGPATKCQPEADEKEIAPDPDILRPRRLSTTQANETPNVTSDVVVSTNWPQTTLIGLVQFEESLGKTIIENLLYGLKNYIQRSVASTLLSPDLVRTQWRGPTRE